MDSMTPSCKCNYLYARTVIGREYACPAVLPLERMRRIRGSQAGHVVRHVLDVLVRQRA